MRRRIGKLFVRSLLILVFGLPLVQMGSTGMALAQLPSGIGDDLYDDLAIGIPGRAVGPTIAGGSVNLLYGVSGGLTATGSQQFDQFNCSMVPAHF
jgi:hypothetical protein